MKMEKPSDYVRSLAAEWYGNEDALGYILALPTSALHAEHDRACAVTYAEFVTEKRAAATVLRWELVQRGAIIDQ